MYVYNSGSKAAMAPMIAVQAAELSVADLLRAYQKAVVPVMAQCDGDCTCIYTINPVALGLQF